MKTTAFLIRVLICFLLSLIPVTEFENRIYSARMELRGHWEKNLDILIVEAPPAELETRPAALRTEALLKERGARQVLLASSANPAIDMQLVPDAGHFLVLERPDSSIAAIERFLSFV